MDKQDEERVRASVGRALGHRHAWAVGDLAEVHLRRSWMRGEDVAVAGEQLLVVVVTGVRGDLVEWRRVYTARATNALDHPEVGGFDSVAIAKATARHVGRASRADLQTVVSRAPASERRALRAVLGLVGTKP